jgi:hypothetical protein
MHEKLNWMFVGFPEWTAQFSVWKTTGKDNSEAGAIASQNCAVYSVFPSGITSHSKIAQFNWECIGRLTAMYRASYPFFSWNCGICKPHSDLWPKESPSVLTRRVPATGVDVITRCRRNLLSDSEQRTRATRRSYVFWRPVRVISGRR